MFSEIFQRFKMDTYKYKSYIYPILAYVFLLFLLYSLKVSDYLYVFLLGLPLLDWRFIEAKLALNPRTFVPSLVALLMLAVIVFFVSIEQFKYFLIMTIFTALPEEWFFRGYLLRKLGLNLRANVIVSIGFSVLHVLVQDNLVAVLTFIPSLVFGWAYIKYRSLTFVIFLHALSNLIYFNYVKDLMP